jgi:CDP-glucose 4,6-dehydratase
MTRYFITGHTGFKGAWLTLLLKEMGHEVIGLSDLYRPNSLYRRAKVNEFTDKEFFSDIVDSKALKAYISQTRPDVVVHMAAQPIVLSSYENPRRTFDTNIRGTINVVLAAVESEVSKILAVTTDKVYADQGGVKRYLESDKLGGHDPYAASKAAADLVVQSIAHLAPSGVRVDVARGGNVIGGGDDSPNRLIPDIERAILQDVPLMMRNPHQTRPWQHALDCLQGYLAIINRPGGISSQWNVGPSSLQLEISNREFASQYIELRGKDVPIEITDAAEKETDFLGIDSNKAAEELGWTPRLTTEGSLAMTAEWFLHAEQKTEVRSHTLDQIRRFLELAD